ncbi:MAG: ABC transporter ATP-binding protein [Rubrivivax sp.]
MAAADDGELPLISLRGVGKAYPVHASAASQLASLWAKLRGRPHAASAFHALQDVTFDVRRGESTALVGVNGAGKSTLLKVIAGVVKPSRGEIVTRGRVGALLELGAGFHPEYTGRENIGLSCALMGLSPAQTRQHVDRIVEFADIGAHIDQPVKHYSSGMVVRLGFAVATALTPDVLITDEVLSVGDESFQRKCIIWMENYLSSGGTLLLCSHSMYHVQKLCRQALWIEAGRVRLAGDAADVTREYLTWHDERSAQARKLQPASAAANSSLYQVRSMQLNGVAGDEAVLVPENGTLTVTGTVHSPDGRVPQVAVGVVRLDGTPVAGCYSEMDGFALRPAGPQLYAYTLELPQLLLLPGAYVARSHAMDPEGMRMFDHVELRFDIAGKSRETGFVKLPHRWS